MDVVIAQFFSGISTGSVLLFAALGLMLTFGQMGVINVAHGEFLMAGAYTAYLVERVVPANIALPFSIVAGFVVGGLLGLLLEGVIIRWMYHRPLDTLLVTFGVSLILQQLARSLFGAQGKSVASPDWLRGKQLHLLGYAWPWSQVVVLLLAVAAVTAVAAVMRFTPLGRTIRATVQNRDLAETVGVSTRAADRWTFVIGSGLAGVGGVAVCLISPSASSNIGQTYIINAFLVVVAGGIGQIRGTVIAAFAVGLLNSLLTRATNGSVATALIFVLVVVFLQIRPQGLFTVRTRSLV